VNYKVQTDASKENLVPKNISKEQASMIYADETDVLNVAMMRKRWWVAVI
jgi:hypothetical protein